MTKPIKWKFILWDRCCFSHIRLPLPVWPALGVALGSFHHLARYPLSSRPLFSFLKTVKCGRGAFDLSWHGCVIPGSGLTLFLTVCTDQWESCCLAFSLMASTAHTGAGTSTVCREACGRSGTGLAHVFRVMLKRKHTIGAFSGTTYRLGDLSTDSVWDTFLSVWPTTLFPWLLLNSVFPSSLNNEVERLTFKFNRRSVFCYSFLVTIYRAFLPLASGPPLFLIELTSVIPIVTSVFLIANF